MKKNGGGVGCGDVGEIDDAVRVKSAGGMNVCVCVLIGIG